MNHIFMSYSREDMSFVDDLIGQFSVSGLETWRDVEDIRGGAEWRAAISQAIRECHAFVVILSPQCTSSKNVTKELSLAEMHQKPIIPVVYQTCEISPQMEYQLAGLQWIDFSRNAYDRAMAALFQALNYQTSGEKSSRPVAAPPLRTTAAALDPPRPRLNFCIYCGSQFQPNKAFCTACGRRRGN